MAIKFTPTKYTYKAVEVFDNFTEYRQQSLTKNPLLASYITLIRESGNFYCEEKKVNRYQKNGLSELRKAEKENVFECERYNTKDFIVFTFDNSYETLNVSYHKECSTKTNY